MTKKLGMIGRIIAKIAFSVKKTHSIREVLPKDGLLNHIIYYPDPIKDRVTCLRWIYGYEKSI
jgi:hypothetical protein